jgi:hypothetical protein
MISVSQEAVEVHPYLADDSARPLGKTRRLQIVLFCVLMAVWISFAGDFIFRTSHVSIDGKRYFLMFDDGMIGMRYAKNLVEHHGLVWNVGERVEGITDPLWVAIMAGSIWIFGTHNAPLAMQIVGLIICLATFAVFLRACMRNHERGLGATTGLLLIVLSYPVAYWALTGMEACAIGLAVAVAAGLHYSYENGNARNPLIVHSCLIVFGYGLRPDGWIAIAPFFAAAWIDALREKRYGLAICAPLAICAVVLLVTLARHAYYGEWVPNTYVLKVEGYDLPLRWANGISFVGRFLSQNSFLVVLMALAGMSKKKFAYLNILAASLVLAYQVYVGGDAWLYWRQLLPVYIVCAYGVVTLFGAFDKSAIADGEDMPRAHGLVLIGIIVTLPFLVFEYQRRTGGDYRLLQGVLDIYAVLVLTAMASSWHLDRVPFVKANSRAMMQAVRAMVVMIVCGALFFGNLEFLPELQAKPFQFRMQAVLVDKAVLSTRLFGAGKTSHMTWAGTYGYYVEGKMIDALGKSDKEIAKLPIDRAVAFLGMVAVPGHAKYDFRETLLKRKPDIIIDYLAWGRQDMTLQLQSSYKLIQSQGVSLCVRNELAEQHPDLVGGSCPQYLF